MKANKTLRTLAAIGVLAVAGAARADVAPGAWTDSFADAKAYADANKTPMVLVWGNIQNGKHCEYCDALWNALDIAEVRAWMAERQYVFCHVWGKNGRDDPSEPQNAGAMRFAQTANETKTALKQYPFVCVYWPKSAADVVIDNFVGRIAAAEFMSVVDGYLGGYSARSSGKFAVGKTVGDRLEAEASTERVEVPLRRDGGGELKAADETLYVTYPTSSGSATASLAIAWAQGEAEKRVCVDFGALPGYLFSAGGEVGLVLADAEGATLDDSLIALVRRGNSPKNPTWVGVKTAEQLAWGEWTMDLEAARAKVASERGGGGEAHLLVCLGGSVWCPDCAKTERYLTDTAEFKAWTAANKVACVAIDIPNLSAASPTTGPCLLTREPRNVSATYSAADPDHGAVQSGAGYLSRWMVSDEAAAAVLARNRQLVGTNTKNGGWNRPERANQYRTGVPVFLLVDASTLKVISRIELFASSSPADSGALAGHIRRFGELLAVEGAADAALEEDNRDISTTTAAIAVDGEAKVGEVSGGDLADVFSVTGVQFDRKLVLTASPAAAANVEWTLSLVQKGDSVSKTVASQKGTGELSVSAELDTADGVDVFAKVEVTGLGSTAASFGADADATVSYSISAKSEAAPGTVGFAAATAEAFVPNGGPFSVAVSRTGGRSGAVRARVFLRDAGDAAVFGFDEANLEWAAGETGEKTVSFEAWRPGDTLAHGSFTLGVEVSEGGAAVGTHSCVVTLADTAAPCFASFDMKLAAYISFAMAEPIELMNVSPGVAATLKKVSGALPAGMSVVYDRKTGTATLKGTPRSAGTFTATYTVTQGRVTGLPATMTITVKDPKAYNPFIGVARAAQTIPLAEEYADGTNVVAGTLTASVTAASRISAKLQTLDGATVSFSGTWTGFEDGTGTAYALLSNRNGMTLELAMDAEGAIAADVNGGEFVGAIPVPETGFGDWAGSYTVTFPENPSEEGDSNMAFATMTVSANGVAKWTATLSDGQSASGSTQLFGRDGDVAYAALFKATKTYAFSSLLRIRSRGGERWSDQTANQIIHDAAGTATFEIVGGKESLLTALGGWWKPNAAPVDLLATFGYGDGLVLESEAFDPVGATATRAGFTLASASRTDRLTFTKNSGAFSGIVSIPSADGKSVRATIKGVLLPGWYSCGCEEPEEGEPALVTRPFGAGIVYYSVRNGRVATTLSAPVYLRTRELAD